MQRGMNFGAIIAVISGGIFGVVTTLEGTVARAVGAINASLLEHLFASFIAIPVIIFLFLRGRLTWDNTHNILPVSALMGVLVLIAVAGIAYAMPRVGVTAGNMTMVFGQIAVAVLIDTLGVAGYDKVPLTIPRIAGLALMIVGVYLVLPRQA